MQFNLCQTRAATLATRRCLHCYKLSEGVWSRYGVGVDAGFGTDGRGGVGEEGEGGGRSVYPSVKVREDETLSSHREEVAGLYFLPFFFDVHS